MSNDSRNGEGTDDHVAGVRAFNRFWTRQMGLLQAGLLQTRFSLTEARVLFEIASRPGCDATTLRAELGLDAGYLSRILGSLKADGLVAARPSPSDARRQLLDLTAEGSDAFSDLDQRSRDEVALLLGRLPADDQRRLVSSMATIRAILAPDQAPPAYVIRPPLPGDLGWVVQRHGAIYAQEHRWDHTFEGLVARVVAEFLEAQDRQREAAWIAERDGAPVGSVLCCHRDDRTAQLRLLLVEPGARGLGIGARLVHECVSFARRAGYERVVLWTNDVLASARRIYEAAGFTLTEEEPHHSFGHDLVGQHWTLDL